MALITIHSRDKTAIHRGSRYPRLSRHLHPLRALALILASSHFIVGCVTNPVSGKQQLNIVSRNELLTLAAQAVPSQFANDYGVLSDARANAYVTQVGRRLLATLTADDMIYKDMPFNFQVVNAAYINAYAFPDGTIAITRGMLAELENEAQLAAVLGHEIAHVNCGHTAAGISKSTLLGAMVTGTTAYLGARDSSWTEMVGTAGQLGTAVVLAHYSRAQERESDEGGMKYLVRAGYDPQGMVEMQKLLVRISGSAPSKLDQLFASHPMSSERLQIATERAATTYANKNKGVLNKAAFDNAMSGIVASREAIRSFATAEAQLAQKAYTAAKTSAEHGLRILPNDYMGLMLLAQANRGNGTIAAAQQAATAALRANPGGARASGILAQCALQQKDFNAALTHLNAFDRQVPGVAATSFYRGLAYDGAGRKAEATASYQAYVTRGGSSSTEGRYATQRLQQLSPPPAQAQQPAAQNKTTTPVKQPAKKREPLEQQAVPRPKARQR